MRTVWKYTLSLGQTTLSAPAGATVVSVGLDPRGELCAWLNIPTDSAEATARLAVLVVGTGHPVHRSARFLATVKQGPFMWHVFSLGGEPSMVLAGA